MNGRTLLVLAVVLFPRLAAAQQPFTLEQILRAPFAENLAAAKKVNVSPKYVFGIKAILVAHRF